MNTTHKILPGDRFRNILRDLSFAKYDKLEKLIEEFSNYVEEDFSDAFIHKMQTICRFLIDNKAYEYVARIIGLSSIIGTYESEEYEGEECVISYAIRRICDESIIAQILENFDCGELTVYFFEYPLPSMIAIEQKKYNTLKLLFDKHICTEEWCCGQWTALQHAAYNGYYKLAELLLTELKHDPNLYTGFDIPPIALAADMNDFKMVELLIRYGADVSATDGDGRTAINYCRSDKMRGIFIENGAVRENLQMRTISHVISSIKHNGFAPMDCIEALTKYEHLLFNNKEGNIILLAAKYGDIDALKCLAPFFKYVKTDDIIYAIFDWYELDSITYRKDIDKLIELTNILIENGVKRSAIRTMLSPYHTLSLLPEIFTKTSEEKAFTLFDNIGRLGYRLDERDCIERTTFHDAIENLNILLVNYCLSKGMSYKELDNATTSAIELLLGDSVCREYKEANTALIEEMLQQLITNGCDINHQDKFGNTPLHNLVSAKNFKEYPIKMLIKNGADLSLKNAMKETAYVIGLRKNLPDRILKLLRPM